MSRLLMRRSLMALILAVLAFAVAVSPVLAVIKTPVPGTNKQAYARFYHSSAPPDCEWQDDDYDVVILVEYNYAAGSNKIRINRFWVTFYVHSGWAYGHYAIIEDSHGNVFGRNDNLWAYMSATKTFAFTVNQTFTDDTSVKVKSRHHGANEPWCGEQDYLSFDLP